VKLQNFVKGQSINQLKTWLKKIDFFYDFSSVESIQNALGFRPMPIAHAHGPLKEEI
jgi:hypothetical protein